MKNKKQLVIAYLVGAWICKPVHVVGSLKESSCHPSVIVI